MSQQLIGSYWQDSWVLASLNSEKIFNKVLEESPKKLSIIETITHYIRMIADKIFHSLSRTYQDRKKEIQKRLSQQTQTQNFQSCESEILKKTYPLYFRTHVTNETLKSKENKTTRTNLEAQFYQIPQVISKKNGEENKQERPTERIEKEIEKSDVNILTIKSLENSSVEDSAQEAYQTFQEDKQLTFTVNRGRSTQSLNSCSHQRVIQDEKSLIIIDKELRNWLNANASKPLHPNSQYYFKNLNGKRCYIDEKGIDRFTEIAKKTFPNLVIKVKRLGIIDTETNIELMSDRTAPDGYVTIDEECGLYIKTQISQWVAKLK